MSNINVNIEKVINIALSAGTKIMHHYQKNLKVIKKNGDPFDLLTIADKEADKFIRKRLHNDLGGGYSILSEESLHEPKSYSGQVWMVDPIDGTKDFVKGTKGFSVMIGACYNGEPVVGVVYSPIKDMVYFAIKGEGAYLRKYGKNNNYNDTKIQVSNIKDMAESKIVTRVSHGDTRILDKMIERLTKKEVIEESSVGLKLGLIASRAADYHINTNNRANMWDLCAPQIILEEAGGKVTDEVGNPIDYKLRVSNFNPHFVASNGYLHDKILKEMIEKA